jgi:uncharacterized cupin superfamily protein
MERRHPNVINVEEVEVFPMQKGRHDMSIRRLGAPAGSQALGAMHITLPPGAISFPMHAHFANEEAIFILSGVGTARIGEARIAVRAGDWVALPTGPAHAHQMVNDSNEALVYLCMSTMHTPEVVLYPESKKIGASVADPQSPRGFKRLGIFHEKDGTVDYWEGEPDAAP